MNFQLRRDYLIVVDNRHPRQGLTKRLLYVDVECEQRTQTDSELLF